MEKTEFKKGDTVHIYSDCGKKLDYKGVFRRQATKTLIFLNTESEFIELFEHKSSHFVIFLTDEIKIKTSRIVLIEKFMISKKRRIVLTEKTIDWEPRNL